MKRIFAVTDYGHGLDAALLAVRLVAGLAFMHHGWGKIQDPTGWMGPEPFAPTFFLVLAALAEFGGGLALMLGLVTRLATLGITSTMIVAVWFHALHRGDPFVAKGGGASYELALIYMCTALLLLAAGPGRFSLDRVFFGVLGARNRAS